MNDDLLARTLATRNMSYPYRFTFESPLDVGFKEKCVEWCEKNCKEEWVVSHMGWRWRFVGERDYLMFCLKWGSR